MEQKYLPIGSVCTLKGKNKKIMITGYYSIEFTGNIKIYDYIGCLYPEGLLGSDHGISFNHSEIENIDFIGFKNRDGENFLKLLNNVSDEKSEPTISSSKNYSKIVFDENGVVVMAEPVDNSNSSKYEFDEDGTVIGISNPFHKEYEQKEETPVDNWDILKETDDEESPEEELLKGSLNKIEFDENGVVISTGENKNKEQYKFDSNGVVIGNGWDTEPTKEQYKFDENGVVIGDSKSNNTSKYKFDENGTVIGINE